MEHPARILLVVGEATSRGSVERGVASAGYDLVAISLAEALAIGVENVRAGNVRESWPEGGRTSSPSQLPSARADSQARPIIALIALINEAQTQSVVALRERADLASLPLMLAMEGTPQHVFHAARELKAEGVCRDL